MVSVKNMPWCKITRISLILERSDVYGYRHVAWSAELVMVVAGRQGIIWKGS